MGINEATSGRIILNGEDITDLSINERAQAGIGFAFQQPPRFKGMTVRRRFPESCSRKNPQRERMLGAEESCRCLCVNLSNT